MALNFIQYGVVAFIFSANLLITQSNCRDLRPSEHGLGYQEDSPPPTRNDDAQEMLTFFGGTTPSLPLPEARNISGTWWNEDGSRRSRDIRGDHLKIGLLVASAVCGLAGIVLLVVSGIIFLFRVQKEKSKEERISSRSGPTPTCEPEVANCK